MFSLEDELGLAEETAQERLARELITADQDLIAALRRLREARGISQAQMAAVLRISQPAVSMFESYDSDPKLSTIRRYALALEAEVAHSVSRDNVSYTRHEFQTASYQPENRVTMTAARPASSTANLGQFAAAKRTDFAIAA